MRNILIFLLTIFLCLKIIKKPVFGIYAAIFFIPFGKFVLVNIGSLGFQYIYFIVLVTFAAESCRLLLYRNGRFPNIFTNNDYWYLILFLLYMVFFSILSFQIPYDSFKGEVPFVRSLKQITLFAIGVLFYCECVYFIKDREQLKKVFKAYIAGMTFLIVVALCEFINYYTNDRITTLLVNMWHNSNTGSGPFSLTVPAGLERGNLPRLRSLLSEPSFLGMHVVLTFFMVLLARARGYITGKKMMILNTLLIGILLFTFSRSSQFVFFAGCGILLFRNYYKIKIKTSMLVLVSAVFCLLVPFILSPLAKSASEFHKLIFESDASGMTRLTNMLTGVNIFVHHMLCGVGIGNYGFYYDQYIYRGITFTNEIAASLNPNNMSWPTSNSLVARMLCELGLAGSCIFIFFQLRIFRLIKRIRDNAAWHSYGTYYLLINLLIVLYYFTNESFQFFVYWFFPALAVVTYNIMKKESAIGYENTDAESMRRPD